MVIVKDTEQFKLQYFVSLIQSIKPGQCLHVSIRELEDAIPSSYYNGALFTSADWVMENIIGSAYEFSYVVDDTKRCFTFSRLEQPLASDSNQRTYTSPDRR